MAFGRGVGVVMDAKIGICVAEDCTAKFELASTGRPRRFCSGRCRLRAWRKQKRRAELASKAETKPGAELDRHLARIARLTRTRRARGMRIALVACSKRKGPERAAASALYRGDLFRLAVADVEDRAADVDAWFVLSALHRLVRPGRQLDPYDLSLGELGRAERASWAAEVLASIKAEVGPQLRGLVVEIHGGRDYWRDLRPALEAAGARVLVIGEGLGIGARRQFYGFRRQSRELEAA